MADAVAIQARSGSKRLRRDVASGRDNKIKVAPFKVLGFRVPAKWDPEEKVMRVIYTISNPNQRATRGRISYYAPRSYSKSRGMQDKPGMLLHRHSLSSDWVRDGLHWLDDELSWDGIITRGPERLRGKRVTADLAPIIVKIEIWNEADRRRDRREHETRRGWRKRVFVSSGLGRTDLDVLVESKWKSNWAVPWDDPADPDRGSCAMRIRVKNIADDTPVRLYVYRLGDPQKDPSVDSYYASSDSDDQPDLKNAVVRNGRVVLPDGRLPEVRFNEFSEHYVYEPISFYGFRIAFGDRGFGLIASERDYVHFERDCLNLRMTVLIQSVDHGLKYTRRYCKKLQRFLGKTKYYRPTLLEGAEVDGDTWIKHFQHKFMVFVTGHCATGCMYEKHPKTKKGKRKPCFSEDFPPDLNVCPDRLLTSAKGKRRRYKKNGGCATHTHVRHTPIIGKIKYGKKKFSFDIWNSVPTTDDDGIVVGPVNGEGKNRWLEIRDMAPTFLFWNGGCRGLMTGNFGKHFVDNTTWYHGWRYSVGDDIDAKFMYRVMTDWIKGSRRDRPKTECDRARFVRVYRKHSRRGKTPTDHPRLMDMDGIQLPNGKASQVEDALS
ncbi:MAG: hypothetical protein ACYTHJ_04035 [Planctomycetota bacterium]|jgi:hypothetical protein